MGGFAWVTLATNDSYALGALVLAHSLRRAGTPHDLVALITPGVSASMRSQLSSIFTLLQEVNVLDSHDEAHLALLERPELGITFTKLHCWRLTQYEKCVFLDADTLVLKNSDELFEREELSAAPDPGWPDCFNSGVFVYRPSLDTFNALIKFALSKGSFDGGDQGLLNLFFSDWATKDISRHLPFIYNMVSSATYSYLPAFKQFGENAKIVHFIGANKPWLQYFDSETRLVRSPAGVEHLHPLLQLWWDIFCSTVHPSLSPDMLGLAGALAQLTLGAPRSAEQAAFEEHMRKQAWEQGTMDYMGRDSFENIWRKISETLSQAPQKQETQKPGESVVDSAVPDVPPPSQVPELKEIPTSAASEKVVSSTPTDVPSPSQEPKEISTTVADEKEKVSNVPEISPVPLESVPTESPSVEVEEKVASPSSPEVASLPEISAPEESAKTETAVPEKIASQASEPKEISLPEANKEPSSAPIVAEVAAPVQASVTDEAPLPPPPPPPQSESIATSPAEVSSLPKASTPKEDGQAAATVVPKTLPAQAPQAPSPSAEKEASIPQQVKPDLPVTVPPTKDPKEAIPQSAEKEKPESKEPKPTGKPVSEEPKPTSPTKTKDVSKTVGKKPTEPAPISPPQTPDAPPSDQAPIPPKRRGHKSASAAPGAEQGASSKASQPQPQQSKGSKPGQKGKK